MRHARAVWSGIGTVEQNMNKVLHFPEQAKGASKWLPQPSWTGEAHTHTHLRAGVDLAAHAGHVCSSWISKRLKAHVAAIGPPGRLDEMSRLQYSRLDCYTGVDLVEIEVFSRANCAREWERASVQQHVHSTVYLLSTQYVGIPQTLAGGTRWCVVCVTYIR